MDPISMAMGAVSLVGMGMSLFGTSKATAAAQQESAAVQQINQLDIQVNAQRQQQMVLQANRQQLQNVRNVQMARSMALTSATSQGAQFGSGLSGGYGQIAGQGNTQKLATNQNLEIGKNIFGLDNQIDQQRILEAQAQGNMATAQGMQSLGGDLMKVGGSQQFGSLLGMIPGMSGSGGGGSMNG
jgi:hypothetical protein